MTKEDQQTPTARDAFQTAIDAANLTDPVVEHGDGRRHLLIPRDYRVENVSDPFLLPDFIRQKVTVDDRASLTGYANRFSDHRSIIVADYDNGLISARLDWHANVDNGLNPEQGAHTATLVLRDSEEYARWSEIENKMQPQADFALFIEENVADVIDPDHSILLEICRDLEATQGVAFKSGTRLENGDRSFRYETETHVKGEVSVPTEIKLSIPLYHGEEPTEIRAKFRFKPTPSGLLLGFRWHRVEYQRQATFRQMAFTAAEDTGLPVFFGRTP